MHGQIADSIRFMMEMEMMPVNMSRAERSAYSLVTIQDQGQICVR